MNRAIDITGVLVNLVQVWRWLATGDAGKPADNGSLPWRTFLMDLFFSCSCPSMAPAFSSLHTGHTELKSLTCARRMSSLLTTCHLKLLGYALVLPPRRFEEHGMDCSALPQSD